MLRKGFVTLFLLVMAFCVDAQDINGFWKGRLEMAPGGCFSVYNIEFQLQIIGSKITGYSYYYSDTSNYVKEEFTGTWNAKENLMMIEEQKVVLFHIPPDCTPCIKKYTLSYHTDGKEEQIRGSWTGRTMDNKTVCPSGTIILIRIQKPAFTPSLPPELISRKNELVREIFVDTGNIRLDFYDNGQIDGDTISVFVNNAAVVSSRMLTLKPVTVMIRIDKEIKEHEVIMVGQNLGTIPPNTALMIVNAGDKRYQLYLTSDLKKNALVRFIYRQPK